MQYILIGACVYFVCLLMMFAYIDNVYYNKVDKLNNKRTIYWSRVIVSSIVIFSISLLFIGIIYNMKENTETTTSKTPITYQEYEKQKPKKNKKKRRTQVELLNEYSDYVLNKD